MNILTLGMFSLEAVRFTRRNLRSRSQIPRNLILFVFFLTSYNNKYKVKIHEMHLNIFRGKSQY